MVLRFLFRTPRRDLGPCDLPPADSLPRTSEGGSGNGTRIGVARKTEAERLLANLEKEGVEVDGKIASIIDDEVARIKAEVARENINEPLLNCMPLVHTLACIALGFMVGAEYCEQAILAAMTKKILFR